MPKLLEVSLSSENVLKDMGLFADIGFEERPVNEIIKHHYGVLGDETFHVGLHHSDFSSPTLTYVVPDVAHFAGLLGNFIEFERADLSDLHFNQVSFYDPGHQRVNLIEARTFSPAFVDASRSHPLGKFQRIELPHSGEREAFWQLVEQTLRPDQDHARDPLMSFSPSLKKLTAVYTGDLEALIVHSAQNGWQTFSVTANDDGLLRTPHQFDILVRQRSH